MHQHSTATLATVSECGTACYYTTVGECAGLRTQISVCYLHRTTMRLLVILHIDDICTINHAVPHAMQDTKLMRTRYMINDNEPSYDQLLHQVRRKTAQHLHQTADTIPPAMSMLTQTAGRQATNRCARADLQPNGVTLVTVAALWSQACLLSL